MTKTEAIANHRKMWTWIADSTRHKKKGVWKSQYFNYIEDVPYSYCYCCHYAKEHSGDNNICNNCPLIWGNKENGKCTDNEHAKWIKAMCKDDWQSAEKYAREIANLPERM